MTLAAPADKSAFMLVNGTNRVFTTTSGGKIGQPSELTIRSSSRRVRKKTVIRVTGKLIPAAGGERVTVLARAVGAKPGTRWTAQERTVSAARNVHDVVADHQADDLRRALVGRFLARRRRGALGEGAGPTLTPVPNGTIRAARYPHAPHLAGSSNGRTLGSGPRSRGSSPCPRSFPALLGFYPPHRQF